MKKVRPHPFLYIFDEGMRSIIMAKRITMNTEKGKSYAEVFARFITARTASGVSDITIRNYHNNLHTIGKYLDIDTPIEKLTKSQIDDMVVAMREAGWHTTPFLPICESCAHFSTGAAKRGSHPSLSPI